MEFIYSGLERGILENRYKAVATILCANAFVRSPAEGNPLEESRIIQVKWEHESGLAKEALIPYHWDGPGKAAIGQIVAGFSMFNSGD
jgi:hypothetical protein